MTMTIGFDVNARTDDIRKALVGATAGLPVSKITVCYDTGDTDTFDRTKMSDDSIIAAIADRINKICDEIDEYLPSEDPDEEAVEAMYQNWLAEQDARHELADATLHHWL